jgi:hypothetical protein
MGGQADDHVRANETAHGLDGEILLADVHAVGFAEDSDVDMVIHDEAGTSLAGQAAQLQALFEHLSGLFFFFAVLEDLDAAVEQGFGDFNCRTPERQFVVGKSVEVGFGRGPGQQSGHGAPRQSASTPTKEKVLTLNRPRAVSLSSGMTGRAMKLRVMNGSTSSGIPSSARAATSIS